jgi:WD40 repeat protein
VTDDGKRLISGGADGRVRFWDPLARSLVVLAEEDQGGPVTAAGGFRDLYAFTATQAGQLRWWNARPGSAHWRYREPVEGGGAAVAVRPSMLMPDGFKFRPAQLAIACPDHTVAIYEHSQRLNNFTPVRRLEAHTASATALAYTPDGAHLVSGGLDGRVVLWDTLSGEQLRSVSHGSGVRSVAVRWDGQQVAAAGDDGRLQVWDLGLDQVTPTGAERSREVLALRVEEEHAFTAAALSPDGLLSAAGTEGGQVLIHDLGGGLTLERLTWHEAPLALVAFFDEALLTVDRAGKARTWDRAGFMPRATVDLGQPVSAAAQAADLLVVALQDGRVEALRASSLEPVGRTQVGTCAALAIDGGGRVALGVGRSLLRWRPGADPVPLGDLPSEVRSLTWLGSEALAGCADGRVRRRDGAAWAGHTAEVTHLEAWVGGLVVSGGADGSWRVWGQGGRELRAYTAPGRVGAIAVSPSGVLVGGRGTLRWLDRGRPAKHRAMQEAPLALRDPVRRGERFAFRGSLRAAVAAFAEARRRGRSVDALAELRAHWELGHPRAALAAHARLEDGADPPPSHYLDLVREVLAAQADAQGTTLGAESDRVHEVAFHPDGRRAYSAGDARTLTEWDLQSGARLRVFRGHAHGILALEVDPAGSRAATGDRQGNVVVWDLGSGAVLHRYQPTKGYINAIRFLPDGRLVFAGGDKRAHAWRPGEEEHVSFPQVKRNLTRLAVSPDGATLVGGGSGGTVYVYDLAQGTERTRWQADPQDVKGLAFVGDDAVWVACAKDKALKRFSLAGGEPSKVLSSPSGIGDTAFRVARGRAATVTRRGTTAILDLATGEELAAWSEERYLFAVALSPDGRQAMAAGLGQRVALWTRDD